MACTGCRLVVVLINAHLAAIAAGCDLVVLRCRNQRPLTQNRQQH
jgi:hypothetical protein